MSYPGIVKLIHLSVTLQPTMWPQSANGLRHSMPSVEIGRMSTGDAREWRHATVHPVPAISVDAIAETGRLILNPHRNLSSPITPPCRIVRSLSRRRHYVHTCTRRRPPTPVPERRKHVSRPIDGAWPSTMDAGRRHEVTSGVCHVQGLTSRWAHGRVKVGPISDSEGNLSPMRTEDHSTRH